MEAAVKSDRFRFTLSGVSVTALLGILYAAVDGLGSIKRMEKTMNEFNVEMRAQAQQIHGHDVRISQHDVRISALEGKQKRTQATDW